MDKWAAGSLGKMFQRQVFVAHRQSLIRQMRRFAQNILCGEQQLIPQEHGAAHGPVARAQSAVFLTAFARVGPTGESSAGGSPKNLRPKEPSFGPAPMLAQKPGSAGALSLETRAAIIPGVQVFTPFDSKLFWTRNHSAAASAWASQRSWFRPPSSQPELNPVAPARIASNAALSAMPVPLTAAENAEPA